jgi:hypothetical protein
VNLFWAAHVVHHQSEDYNLGTALRQSGSGLFDFVFYLPWLYVGIPPEILFTSGAINLVYQFWVHTEHVPKLGWLEYVFVTASNHRVHHAQNDIYIDRNYGGIFIFWDRLFGSFQEELAEQPCVYGIRKPLHSYNPFWANVHVYWSVLQDAWRAPLWRDKLRIWFKRPGWRPAGIPATHPAQRASLEHFRKYDPPVDHPTVLYAFFQFVCATLAAVGMLVSKQDWTSTPWLYLAGLVLFSFYVHGAWAEGRAAARWLEWIKLAWAAAMLVWLPLHPSVLLAGQVYLLLSFLLLGWLTLNMSAASANAR